MSHAILSASASHKWLNCPPSARLELTFPDNTSQYAEEGRLAHEIAELKLRKLFAEPMHPKTYSKKLQVLKQNPLYQDEMLKHTDVYADYILGVVHGHETPPYITVEKKLDYSNYAPEGFGTGDCIIIGGNMLHIIDLKYGKGLPVSAENNSQMKLYALGAQSEYSFLYAIEKVKMVIVQPRLDSISEYEMPSEELLVWGESIKPIAEKAFKGEGEFNSGDHCRFCKAKSLCRARAEFNTSLESFKGMLPPLITNDEVGQLLIKAQDLAKWAKDLEEYALAECLKGGEIQGWKAVEGRGSRSYVNQDEAFNYLVSSGIDEAMLYERKPLTVPVVEKSLGKKLYKELLYDAGHVKVEPGKPTLVPQSDKRQAISEQVNLEEIFERRNENE